MVTSFTAVSGSPSVEESKTGTYLPGTDLIAIAFETPGWAVSTDEVMSSFCCLESIHIPNSYLWGLHSNNLKRFFKKIVMY